MHQFLSKRKILAVCVAASLVSHIISLLFLQKHSFWASSPRSPPPAVVLIDKAEANQILREAFQEGAMEEKSGSKEPHTENRKAPSFSISMQTIEPPSLSLELNISEAPLKTEFAFQVPSFTLPPVQRLNLFEHLPKDLIVPLPEIAHPHLAIPTFLPREKVVFSPSIVPSDATPDLFSDSHPVLVPSLPERGVPSQVLKPSIHLPEFPSLQDLGTSSYSQFFDAEIVFSPLESGEGYVFALTLVPQTAITLPKIRQHYSFLIDRSNSIQKERLNAVKSAVLKAIEELDLNDSFNIIAFDSKIDKLSPAPLPATPTSLKAAKNFLNSIQLGSFFSTTNITKPLLLTVPSSQDDEIHTAILFSDGEVLSKKTTQRELGLDWTAYNNGRVSLFAIGIGGDPHLSTLDAFTAFNRGKLLYPPTKRGIKRKLLKLIKTISYPLAKNLTATAISRSSQTKITLYPPKKQMPSLFLDEPYVILGTIDKLDDFILFIQGKLKNQWLNIKKPISFVNAKKGDASLYAEWALQRAYCLYESYLYDLNPGHLAEAKELLEPHDIQTAFQ